MPRAGRSPATQCRAGTNPDRKIAPLRALALFILRLFFRRIRFHLECFQESQHGRIEDIHPHHRPRAFVTVLVPISCRGQNHVSWMHDALFAIHGGVGAFPIDHETHGIGGVAMWRRYLAWHQILERDGNGMRCGEFRHSRIGDAQDATLRALSRDRQNPACCAPAVRSCPTSTAPTVRAIFSAESAVQDETTARPSLRRAHPARTAARPFPKFSW